MTVELVRTGYPLLLTVGLLPGRLELATIALQILLSYVSVFMISSTAVLLFEREGNPIIAALLYAIDTSSTFREHDCPGNSFGTSIRLDGNK